MNPKITQYMFRNSKILLNTLLPLLIIAMCSTLILFVYACSSKKKIKIGLSMDSLRVERWRKDRDIFIAEAKKLGAEVIVQSADGDERRQNEQAENLLTQGVDILVVIPKDSVAASQIVKSAHAEGIKVIAYDRLIRESEPDLYISFDNEKVGYLQAEYLLRKKPKGELLFARWRAKRQ